MYQRHHSEQAGVSLSFSGLLEKIYKAPIWSAPQTSLLLSRMAILGSATAGDDGIFCLRPAECLHAMQTAQRRISSVWVAPGRTLFTAQPQYTLSYEVTEEFLMLVRSATLLFIVGFNVYYNR
jgi:hypothetical protein